MHECSYGGGPAIERPGLSALISSSYLYPVIQMGNRKEPVIDVNPKFFKVGLIGCNLLCKTIAQVSQIVKMRRYFIIVTWCGAEYAILCLISLFYTVSHARTAFTKNGTACPAT